MLSQSPAILLSIYSSRQNFDSRELQMLNQLYQLFPIIATLFERIYKSELVYGCKIYCLNVYTYIYVF